MFKNKDMLVIYKLKIKWSFFFLLFKCAKEKIQIFKTTKFIIIIFHKPNKLNSTPNRNIGPSSLNVGILLISREDF